MTLHINTGGLWKEAKALVRVSGAWKAVDTYVRQGGVWYQAGSNGIHLIIDSPTTLYDFNLKSYLQGAGLWSDTKAVIIDSITITARTRITQYIESDVPDGELIHGVSTPRRTWVGHTTYIFGPNANGCYTHIHCQDDPDLYPAFTTGAGWPAGSMIKVFTVLGAIYGRGADGMGMCKTYSPIFQVQAGGANSPRFSSWAGDGPGQGKTLRHAYPALKLTIPVTTFDVTSGLVAGGGASGARITFCLSTAAGDTLRAYFANAASWPTRLLQKHLVDNPGTVGSSTPVRFFSWVMSHAFLSFGPMDFGYATGMYSFHGGGGGQGGGIGGRGVQTGGAYAILSRPVCSPTALDGGDGTFSAPGAAAVTTLYNTTTDSKDTSYSYTGYQGCWDGAPWGQAQDKAAYYIGAAQGGAAAPAPGELKTSLAVGSQVPPSQSVALLVTRTSQPGAGVLGNSNLATVLGAGNILGSRV